MKRLIHWLLMLAAEILYGLMTALLRLSDERLLGLLEGVEGGLHFFQARKLAASVEEVRAVFASGPEASKLLRRFIGEARPRQVKLILVGAMKNRLGLW